MKTTKKNILKLASLTNEKRKREKSKRAKGQRKESRARK